MTEESHDWDESGLPTENEIRLLREALVRYGDRQRMATSFSMELQQVIDRAFQHTPLRPPSLIEEYEAAIAGRERAPEPQPLRLSDAFDMGFSWSLGLRGQTLEDSRAVGRTLMTDALEPIHDAIRAQTEALGFDSFQNADHGIVAAKAIIMAALDDGTNVTTRDRDGWLRPYRTMDESGEDLAAGTVGWNWINRIAEEARAVDPERLNIETPDRSGALATTLLYRGPRIIAATFVLRDQMNWSVLMRWRAGREVAN